MVNPAIETKNLSYQYPGSSTNAVINANLAIPHGSFCALIGPSGSGKSSLLFLLRGFYKEFGGQLQGTIKILGRDIKNDSIATLGQTVGIVFQNPALQLHQLRVIDEVASAPMYHGLPYKECQTRATNLVDKFLGKDFYSRSPADLSGGEQQKTALAASLSLNAEILLLDEPFSFLDQNAAHDLVRHLVDLHRQGKTIIVATHDLDLISDVATQIVVIKDGDLVLQGPPKKVFYSDLLSSILPPPLFVQASQKLKLTDRPLSWQGLLPKTTARRTRTNKTLSPTSRPLLSLKNVSFIYPDSHRGIKSVSVNVNKGEIFGLIGANGSGKTTLAKLIIGLLRPQSGQVFLDNTNVTHLPIHQRARSIGYVTQDPLDMFFETDLWKEVAAGPRFLGLPDPKSLAHQTLQELNLWKYKDVHPDSISGGEKSLLGLADIFVFNPMVLLLDVPEFGLDPKNWEKITTALRKFQAAGKTIIVITHNLEAAFFLCDTIGVVADGSLLKVAAPLEIFTNEALLKKAGLSSLPFSPLLKNIPNNVALTKELFLNSLKIK
ncbi:ATP-binding cassette domain-containing protein [Candidatus Microgenomates bacterium]|nr:ATP-binding cassette domain-containing protein [Candidatus Microgenomates bacterium]